MEQASSVLCPRCSSDRTHPESRWGAFGAGVLFLVLGLALLAANVWIALIVGGFGLLAMVAAPFGPARRKCRECGKGFTP